MRVAYETLEGEKLGTVLRTREFGSVYYANLRVEHEVKWDNDGAQWVNAKFLRTIL